MILGNSEGIRAGAVSPGLEFGKPLRVDLFNDIATMILAVYCNGVPQQITPFRVPCNTSCPVAQHPSHVFVTLAT